jgi:preprotein translocase subunit SecE
MDFLVIVHLMVGAMGMFLLLRLITLDGRAAFWGAVTFELNSFVIYVSTCWMTLSGPAAYFPWMVYFSLRLLDGGLRVGTIGLSAAHLLLLLIGYPQALLYCAAFELLVFAAVAAGRFRSDRTGVAAAVWRYAASWVVPFVFSLPLLLPMWHQTTISAFRKQALSWEAFRIGAFTIGYWLSGLFNPFSNTHYANTPIVNWLQRSLPYLSHIGYATLALIGIGMVAFFRDALDETRKKYCSVCLAGALVSFLWSINAYAGIVYLIPVLNRLRWPFKLQLHTAFFLVVVAAIGLAWLLGALKNQWAARSVFAAATVATFANFLLLYLVLPARTFRTHLESVPLAEPLRERLGEGRMLTVGYRFEDQKSANSLGYSYATLWGLQSIAGYDPLVPERNHEVGLGLSHLASYGGPPDQLPIAHLRRWGVRWYIVSNGAPEYPPVLLKNGMTPYFRDEDRTVYHDSEASPLVCWERGGVAGIDYRLTTNTIQVDVDSRQEDHLRLRFVGDPFFNASVDGRRTELATDQYGQMSLRVPAGRHRIVVRYRDRYLVLGSLLAAAAAALLAGVALARRARPARPETP